MKQRSTTNALILFCILGIVLLFAAGSPAAIDSDAQTTTPPVITGSQLAQEKIDFLMATLKDRLEQFPEADRPALFTGQDFPQVSGLAELHGAILDPDHPLHAAFAKAGRLHQDAQVRPALADDANLYLNLAILSALDELLKKPSMADEVKNTVYALIDLLKELELPEAYQVPDTRFGFNTFGRSDPRDRIERADDPGDINVVVEESGFKYYGKEYDLDSDVAVYDEGFIVFDTAPANGSALPASAYRATAGDFLSPEADFPLGDLDLQTNMPAMLSPLVRHPDFGGVRVTGNGVEKTDLRYTYRWRAEYDWWPQVEMPDAVAMTKTVSPVQPEMPVLDTSVSLYRNDWIVFNYEARTASGDFPFIPMPGVAGLSPGDGTQGSGHPGEGLPRDWESGAGFAMAPVFDSLPLTYDVDENTYTAIYNGYFADGFFGEGGLGASLPLVFANTFYIFRPYEWGEEGMVATPNKYMVSAGTRSILAGGLSSLDEAIGYVADDPSLLEEIDGGAFSPGNYEFGFQADADWIGGQLIEGDGFIAYAVQVEEDIVNRKILEMHQDAFRQERIRSLMEDINTAKEFAQIRERDDWMTRNADAQAGRVLRDHKGNWVRVQQYVLRPDANTVQILSASLRDVGGQPELSTLDFTTTFLNDGYSVNNDLRKLPWNRWLNTWQGYGKEPFSKDGVNFKFVHTLRDAPLLDAMTVTIQNPQNDTFQESRTFAGEFFKQYAKQMVTREVLMVNEDKYTNLYDYDNPDPSAIEYATAAASGGFSYRFADAAASPIHVSMYELSDNFSKKSEKRYDDIWDALRVNEDKCHNIGDSALEMVITDGAETPRFNEFDVVYIPMSRMLWKDKPGDDA